MQSDISLCDENIPPINSLVLLMYNHLLPTYATATVQRTLVTYGQATTIFPTE